MRQILLCLCAVLASGCAQQPQEVTVDVGPLRCPPVAASDTRVLTQRPEYPPAGDVTKAAAQVWIDTLHAQIRAMSKAGRRVTWQYNQCRGDAVKRAG